MNDTRQNVYLVLSRRAENLAKLAKHAADSKDDRLRVVVAQGAGLVLRTSAALFGADVLIDMFRWVTRSVRDELNICIDCGGGKANDTDAFCPDCLRAASEIERELAEYEAMQQPVSRQKH